jgi:SAM-dependent methyltransferase
VKEKEPGAAEIKYVHEELIHTLTSPQKIVPEVTRLLQPKSVLDVGCGIGTFLAVFAKSGIADYAGVDGYWVAEDKLLIGKEHFRAIDLEKEFDLGRSFDLVVCLEVAEHVSESASDPFVQSLVNHGKTILFSAAIRNQGGQNHVNEQNFDYWQRKFKRHGYYFYDVLRPLFWNAGDVQWWYKQNMFLVVHESAPLPPDIAGRRLPDNANTQAHPDLVEFYHQLYLQEAEKTRQLKAELKAVVWGDKKPVFYIRGLLKTVRNLFR